MINVNRAEPEYEEQTGDVTIDTMFSADIENAIP